MYKLLFFFVFSILVTGAFGQGITISSLTTMNSTAVSCDSLSINFSAISAVPSNADVNVLINGTNFSTTSLNVQVNWGDGSQTTHLATINQIGQSIVFQPAVRHQYAQPGTYMVNMYVINSGNNTFASTQFNYNYQPCNITIPANVILDCNNDGVTDTVFTSNVPMMLVNTNMTTYYNSSLNNGQAVFQNVLPGTYSLTVPATWQSSNGYLVSYNNPPFITINSSTTTYPFSSVGLICDTVATNMCAIGFVFCDSDNNGVYSSNESVLPNVPFTLVNGNVAYGFWTNSNGYFNGQYQGLPGSATTIQVNPNYVLPNGGTINSGPYTFMASTCTSQTTVPIPVNCGNFTNPTSCVAVTVFCDPNDNGILDNGETPIPNAPLTIIANPFASNLTIYTDSNGVAQICGNYFQSTTLFASINQNWLGQHGYQALNVNFTIQTSPAGTTNMAYYPIDCSPTLCADLWTSVTPWIGYFQGTTAYIKLKYGNYGPLTATSGTLQLTLPAGVSVVTSSINIPGYTISGNTISWNIAATPNFQFTDIIQVIVPSGLPSGTPHNFIATITPSSSINDCNQTNNTSNLLQILGSSYDPNDKTVNLPEQISPVVDDYLTYVIRFQNTGTAPAQNVYIMDTLSPYIDWSSVQVLETSHPMNLLELNGGILRFDFPQIWLADSTTNEPLSHGHVVYRVKENPGNGSGIGIANTASIYFDWNDPVVTNTTWNVNADLAVIDNQQAQFVVYPNPATNAVTISGQQDITAVQLMDMMGNLVYEMTANSKQLTIATSDLQAGVYILAVSAADSTTRQAFIKQ
jgi:uncharacterized repeat protein (TIGR01451 family)